MYLLAKAGDNIGTATGFCSGTAAIWKLVGNILNIFKIVIPLIIIIFGMIDLGKAVMSSKPEEVSKSAKSLLFRIIAGIVIFFVPTLIGFVFTIVDSFGDVSSDYEVCSKCITHPKNCDVSKSK